MCYCLTSQCYCHHVVLIHVLQPHQSVAPTATTWYTFPSTSCRLQRCRLEDMWSVALTGLPMDLWVQGAGGRVQGGRVQGVGGRG